jgi:D-3-phosphoglycerate dehydrogenase
LVTDHVFPNLDPETEVLKGVGRLLQAGSEKDLLEMARHADAVLNCYLSLSPDFVGAMEKCRVIARYGIGIDTIPVETAPAREIQLQTCRIIASKRWRITALH